MGVTPSRATLATTADGDAAAVVVRVFACTDVGRAREHNEDAFLVADLTSGEQLHFDDQAGDPPVSRTVPPSEAGLLLMVADGLGGAAAGEVASHMAVNAVLATMREGALEAGTDPNRLAGALRDAVLAANDAIHRHAHQHRELRGMGTTVTAAVVRGDTVFLAQVGDSRAYVIRERSAQQITKDQSLMQKLVEAGEITPEQAETSARRNIILQALGPELHVKVDVTHQTLRRGDVLLLCSDGLSGQVRADEIAAYAAAAPDIDVFCRSLIDCANERGGPDNITVVAARFDGTALRDAVSDDAIGHQAFPFDAYGAATVDAITLESAPPPALAELAAAAAEAAARRAAAEAAEVAERQAALEQRRARVRPYYLALGVAALLIAVLSLWRFFAA